MPTEYDSVTNPLNDDPQATSGSHSRLAVVLRLLNQCGRSLQTAQDEKHLLQQVCSDLTRGSHSGEAAIYLVKEERTPPIHPHAWNSNLSPTEPPLERWDHAEDYPGVGAELALALKSLPKTGGQIHAGNRLGVGSTFYLEIPT